MIQKFSLLFICFLRTKFLNKMNVFLCTSTQTEDLRCLKTRWSLENHYWCKFQKIRLLKVNWGSCNEVHLHSKFSFTLRNAKYLKCTNFCEEKMLRNFCRTYSCDFALSRKNKFQNKRRKFVCPQKWIPQHSKKSLDSQK